MPATNITHISHSYLQSIVIQWCTEPNVARWCHVLFGVSLLSDDRDRLLRHRRNVSGGLHGGDHGAFRRLGRVVLLRRERHDLGV